MSIGTARKEHVFIACNWRATCRHRSCLRLKQRDPRGTWGSVDIDVVRTEVPDRSIEYVHSSKSATSLVFVTELVPEQPQNGAQSLAAFCNILKSIEEHRRCLNLLMGLSQSMHVRNLCGTNFTQQNSSMHVLKDIYGVHK